MKLLIPIIACLALAGCKADLNKSAEQAQVRLVGKSQDQIAQCMGLPHRTGNVAGYEVWEYSTGTETNVSGRIDYYGNLQMNSRSRNCTASVSFNKDGRVVSINYSGTTGGSLMNKQWKCGELVQSCF